MTSTVSAPRDAFSDKGKRPMARLGKLYLLRAVVAVAWAIALLASDSNGHVQTLLLVSYPLFDVVASLVDARIHSRSAAARIQYANAVMSFVAAASMLIAALGTKAAAVVVFGVWAVASGLVQLVLAARRRKRLGGQTIQITSGALSAIAGINFVIESGSPAFSMQQLSIYATLGAFFYILSAIRLGKAGDAE